ncbi:MAG: 50S ribosomal protein L3 [Oscillospiraceae bacterium]|nr:50S ribosomal protein L3 [Oscillospiraceae bacterium]
MKGFILGRKMGMAQVFSDDGTVTPVTVIKAGPCTVVQMKTEAVDGYAAAKLGFEDVRPKKVCKPENGVFLKAKVTPKRFLREFRTEAGQTYEVGHEVRASDAFGVGDKVDVSGISKGKGFAGAIKRHGMSIGRMTHGSKYHRGVGALAMNTTPGKVFKGRKMPGHMGVDRVTVQNLGIVKVDANRDVIMVKGAVPGAKGAILEIRSSVKSAKGRG